MSARLLASLRLCPRTAIRPMHRITAIPRFPNQASIPRALIAPAIQTRKSSQSPPKYDTAWDQFFSSPIEHIKSIAKRLKIEKGPLNRLRNLLLLTALCVRFAAKLALFTLCVAAIGIDTSYKPPPEELSPIEEHRRKVHDRKSAIICDSDRHDHLRFKDPKDTRVEDCCICKAMDRERELDRQWSEHLANVHGGRIWTKRFARGKSSWIYRTHTEGCRLCGPDWRNAIDYDEETGVCQYVA